MKPRDVVFSRALRRSFGVAALLSLFGGAAAVWLVGELTASLGWEAALPAFLLGAGVFSIPAVAGGVLLHWMAEYHEQQHALTNIRPLAGLLPLYLRDAAVDARFADLLVQNLLRHRPRLVVECGSGSSTVLTAACLREIGVGRVVSLEHEAEYAEQTRNLLRERGLEQWAEVVFAPLREWEVGGRTVQWYNGDLEQFPASGVEMLVVDGPPRKIGPRARYPAVPLLRSYLAPGCVLLLDDGNRPDERWIARRWAAELGTVAEYHPSRKGAWLLRCKGRERLRLSGESSNAIPSAHEPPGS